MASKPKLAYGKLFKQKRSDLLVQKQRQHHLIGIGVKYMHIIFQKSNQIVIISVDLHFRDYITKTEQNKTEQQ